jgi:predicted ATPase/Tfp pilus assembly protein PilF
VASLLDACQDLHALVTSRIPLHLVREHESPVPPLSVPDLNRLPDLPHLSQYEAVALFIERARAVQPDFSVTNDNAPAVAEICYRLDGLPLAIDLAAARIRLLPPAALLARLSSRLTLLTGGARDAPTRQQTLRGTLEWSYGLLDEEEQRLFARLGVFQGGCTLTAAEAVPGAEEDLDVLDGMGSLVENSLLRQVGEEEPRFLMLETIREFAVEKLVESGQEDLVRQWHAKYCLGLAEDSEPGLRGADQAAWLDRLEREHHNFRAALNWLLQSRQVDTALRLAGLLSRFWMQHGHFSEGLRWLEAAFADGGVASPAVRASALVGAGRLLIHQGDYERAGELTDESLSLYRQLGDEQGISRSLHALGVSHLEQGRYEQARALVEESLTLNRELRDPWAIAMSLATLGKVAHEQGDYQRAAQLYEEVRVLFQELGVKDAYATTLNNLGRLACDQGDYGGATRLYEEGLAVSGEISDQWDMSYSLEGLATVAGAQGRTERAARLWAAAERLREAIGVTLSPAERQRHESDLSRRRSQVDEESWGAAWQEGRLMTLEQAVAYAPEEGSGTLEVVGSGQE